MSQPNLIRFDWAIKRLLRNKANYAVLEGFLSVLLGEDVKIREITDSESNKDEIDDKFNRVDILAENMHKELFIIELQNSNEVDYFLRMLYGVSKAITERMKCGDKYNKVRKVYSINIVYFELGHGDDYVYHGKNEFRGLHCHDLLQMTARQKEFLQKDEISELYPEYYILKLNGFDNVAKDSLDEWIYYLKNNEIPDSFTAKGLAEAREMLQYDSLTEEERKSYVHHIDQNLFESNVLETSRMEGKSEGIEIGRVEGIEIGRVEGKSEGIEIGRAEGIEEGRIEIARNSLKANIPIETIAQITGLTPEQLKTINIKIK